MIDTLTPRQRDVVAAMIEHGSMKLVGRAVGASEQTVKDHMARVRRKLGLAHNIAVCVAFALSLQAAEAACPAN